MPKTGNLAKKFAGARFCWIFQKWQDTNPVGAGAGIQYFSNENWDFPYQSKYVASR